MCGVVVVHGVTIQDLASPLVDDQQLIGEIEPGNPLQPEEPTWDGAVQQEMGKKRNNLTLNKSWCEEGKKAAYATFKKKPPNSIMGTMSGGPMARAKLMLFEKQLIM